MKNLKKRNDFLSIKENINNNILDKLAGEISSAETEDGIAKFDVTEFNIDGILFFVTGHVEYIEKYNDGDWDRYIEPSYERKLYDSNLEIVWNDGTMDEDLSLTKEQIEYINKMLDAWS